MEHLPIYLVPFGTAVMPLLDMSKIQSARFVALVTWVIAGHTDTMISTHKGYVCPEFVCFAKRLVEGNLGQNVFQKQVAYQAQQASQV